MARIARVVAAGIPHHVTQRGNRGVTTFLTDEDYQTYIVFWSPNGAGSAPWRSGPIV